MPRPLTVPDDQGLSRSERALARRLGLEELPTRPLTRAECLPGGSNELRPCPFVSCRHHLYLEAKPSGSLAVAFPDIAPQRLERLEETCALDVADNHPKGVTLDRVGQLLNITRERIRQIEVRGLRKLREAVDDWPDVESAGELR